MMQNIVSGIMVPMLNVFRGKSKTAGWEYFSTPVTSGTRLIDWHVKNPHVLDLPDDEYYKLRKEAVVLPNLEAGRQLYEEMFGAEYTHHHTVVNPASFFVKGWKDNDYYEFWKAFLLEYKPTVLTLEVDSLKSKGCALEVMTVLKELPRTRIDAIWYDTKGNAQSTHINIDKFVEYLGHLTSEIDRAYMFDCPGVFNNHPRVDYSWIEEFIGEFD